VCRVCVFVCARKFTQMMHRTSSLSWRGTILSELKFRNQKEVCAFNELVRMQQQYLIAKRRERGYQETISRLSTELMNRDEDEMFELLSIN